MAKPRPVPVELVCSECGLDWDLHPNKPRRRDCIELLKEQNVMPCTRNHYPPWSGWNGPWYWGGTTLDTATTYSYNLIPSS